MGLFTSCFGQKEEKHIYLAGWEVELNGDDACQKFINTQVIDEKTANTIWSSIEIVFVDGKLIKANDIDEGIKSERTLNENELNFSFINIEPIQLYEFQKTSNSESYLGGEIPKDFTLPKFKFNAPFQYLGKFSKSDKAFSWLPFDIHLVAPIYLNFDKLFIDYSDPMNPKVLDIEKLRETDNYYDDLKPNSEIVYEKTYISTRKSNDFGTGIGHSGVPSWIQYPEIPTCPNSEKTMRFLGQLKSVDAVKTKRTDVHPEDDWYVQYFEYMNFWGDGDLFIFFDPESKIACFIIQNT